MELWDAYDKDFNKIDGMTLVRGKEKNIPSGVYHLICGILVRHVDGTILITKRDKKKIHGGMWEATCGGSAILGETPYECAFRELYEETGIKGLNLTEIEKIFSEEGHCIFVGFLCVTDCNKNSITLQKGETCDYRWINHNELISMGKDKLLTEWILKFVHFF